MNEIVKFIKRHKKYSIYVLLGLVMCFWVEGCFQSDFVKFFNNVPAPVVAILILVATTISLYAVDRFGKDVYSIEREANRVEINKSALDKIEAKISFITGKKVKIVVAFLSVLTCRFVVEKASKVNSWNTFTYIYALVTVGMLIAVTFYGYIYFFQIIVCMKTVYEWEFRKYIYIYPLATRIFSEFNNICTYGLFCFWMIGFILILLSSVVFDANSSGVMVIIGVLIFIGYLSFTFYPYYLTRKKVFLLKLQTIRTICLSKNMLEKQNYNQYSEIIRIISDSPNVLSTNFNLALSSTLTAVAGVLTSIFTFWK